MMRNSGATMFATLALAGVGDEKKDGVVCCDLLGSNPLG